MFKDLIEYNGLEEACAEMFGFSDVTFLRDFGPWKKGQRLGEDHSLWFNLETSVAEEHGPNGVVATAMFQLTTI
jgi:hypothetical protein